MNSYKKSESKYLNNWITKFINSDFSSFFLSESSVELINQLYLRIAGAAIDLHRAIKGFCSGNIKESDLINLLNVFSLIFKSIILTILIWGIVFCVSASGAYMAYLRLLFLMLYFIEQKVYYGISNPTIRFFVRCLLMLLALLL